MKFPAKGGEDFAPVQSGNHVGICNAVVDLGVQPGSGQYPDPKHQVYIRFELPTERIKYQKDGKEIEGPMSIGRTFTASMSTKANLRKFVESWRGASFTDAQAEDFDFRKLIGQRCLLNVTHRVSNEKVYANIANATPLPRGMTSTQPQHNPSLFYDLATPDQAAFELLPEWLRKKISERLEQEQHETDPGYSAEDSQREPIDDDIPF